jgi:hypothetical protein
MELATTIKQGLFFNLRYFKRYFDVKSKTE